MIRLAFFLAFCVSSLAGSQVTLSCGSITSDYSLRRVAIKTVDPVYPPDAIARRVQGLAVAEICVSRESSTPMVRVDVAPSEAIKRAMYDALRQWVFQPPASAAPSFGGKILYYFLYHKNIWRVFEPRQIFFVGPKFASGEPGVEKRHF